MLQNMKGIVEKRRRQLPAWPVYRKEFFSDHKHKCRCLQLKIPLVILCIPLRLNPHWQNCVSHWSLNLIGKIVYPIGDFCAKLCLVRINGIFGGFFLKGCIRCCLPMEIINFNHLGLYLYKTCLIILKQLKYNNWYYYCCVYVVIINFFIK